MTPELYAQKPDYIQALSDFVRGRPKDSELYIFEDCSHAPLYENVPANNEKTLGFLSKHAG